MDFLTIEGSGVDLLSPFPLAEAGRIYGWSKPSSFSSVSFGDHVPDEETFTQAVGELLKVYPSFAIVDKNNAVVPEHIPAGLVGAIVLEPKTPQNAYIHISARRKAAKLTHEAMSLAIQTAFASGDSLLRISAWVPEENKPARLLARRVGFKEEGRMESWGTFKGEPYAIIHYGLTREDFEKCQSQPLSQQSQQVSVPSEEGQRPEEASQQRDSSAQLSEREARAASPAPEKKSSPRPKMPGLPLPPAAARKKKNSRS